MDNANKTYSTKGIQLAAYLMVTQKVDFIGTTMVNGRTHFLFNNPPLCEQLISDYYSHRTQVDAKALFVEFNSLKDLLFLEGGKHELYK